MVCDAVSCTRLRYSVRGYAHLPQCRLAHRRSHRVVVAPLASAAAASATQQRRHSTNAANIDVTVVRVVNVIRVVIVLVVVVVALQHSRTARPLLLLLQ